MEVTKQDKKKFKLDIFLLSLFIASGLILTGATLLGRYFSIKFLQALSLKLFSPLGVIILFAWFYIVACAIVLELEFERCCCATCTDESVVSQAKDITINPEMGGAGNRGEEESKAEDASVHNPSEPMPKVDGNKTADQV
jgi:hypothetical protein